MACRSNWKAAPPTFDSGCRTVVRAGSISEAKGLIVKADDRDLARYIHSIFL